MSSDKKTAQVVDEVEVALIGAGIMSATLGAMLRELEPSWTQMVFERLDGPALESPPRGTTLVPVTLHCAS